MLNNKTWIALQEHQNKIQATHLPDLFKNDTSRIKNLTVDCPDIYFDFSKNHITEETLSLFETLLEDIGFDQKKEALFSGEKINITEERAVHHTRLRALDPGDKEISETLDKMRIFTEAIHDQRFTGATGKPITDIVNIGIGGSELGPRMVTRALRTYHMNTALNIHYVSNIDGAEIASVLEKINPEQSLFVVASKTFTTQETLTNAHVAKDWLVSHLNENSLAKHFIGITAAPKKAYEFGILPDHVFPMWDWVGGRFSLWSAIGLSIMLAVGEKNFTALLKGAHNIDTHFKSKSLRENIPVLMAIIGIWYRNFFGYQAQAILPYAQDLELFPAYLQQLDMESNGKSVGINGDLLSHHTGPITFGQAGTNGQHAFYQHLHQSQTITPAEFILIKKPLSNFENNHSLLLANGLAQSQALMMGETNEAEPHKNFSGNRPSSTLLFNELSPYSLGQLIAIYEHKITAQGLIWGINSFDQWGVELGKKLAKNIINACEDDHAKEKLDASTYGLLKKIQE